MRKSVIKDIFYGERGHIESISIPNEKRAHTQTICEAYDNLKKLLTPEQWELHEQFTRALEANFCEEIDFYFVEGFKLGLLVGIESMDNE